MVLLRRSSTRNLSSQSQPRQANRQERIPETLQTVFLASNRGKDVHKPPPKHVAFRIFERNWLFQRQTTAPLVSKKHKQNRRFFFKSKPEVPKKLAGRRKSNSTDIDSPFSSPPSSPLPSAKKIVIETVEMATPSLSTQMSPQGYIDSLLRSRGYSTQKFKVLETAYYNRATPLQLASHHVKLVELIRSHNGAKLQELLQCGLSPNACNNHGESLLHNVCRRGDYKLLQIMVQACGASVQVSDDHGRTPMHDACWSSEASFATIDIVLQQDNRMFHLQDARGATPLNYIRMENWAVWIKFLKARADIYWPARNVDQDGKQGPPELCQHGPNTRPLPDPQDALSIELATMVVSGRISPDEAKFLNEDDGSESESESDEEEEDDDDDDEEDSDDSDSDYSDSDFSDSDFDFDGLEDLLGMDMDGGEDEEESDHEEEKRGSISARYGHGEPLTKESCTSKTYGDCTSSHSLFDEDEIADLIYGITAPKDNKQDVAWTASMD